MSVTAKAATGHMRRAVSTSSGINHRSNCGDQTLLVRRNQARIGVISTHSWPRYRPQPAHTIAAAPSANASEPNRLRSSTLVVSRPRSWMTVHVAAKVPNRSCENV